MKEIMPEEKPFLALFGHFAQVGQVVWIGIRAKTRGTIQVLTETYANIEGGSIGFMNVIKNPAKGRVVLEIDIASLLLLKF